MAAHYQEKQKELDRKLDEADCAMEEFLKKFHDMGETATQRLQKLIDIAGNNARHNRSDL